MVAYEPGREVVRSNAAANDGLAGFKAALCVWEARQLALLHHEDRDRGALVVSENHGGRNFRNVAEASAIGLLIRRRWPIRKSNGVQPVVQLSGDGFRDNVRKLCRSGVLGVGIVTIFDGEGQF